MILRLDIDARRPPTVERLTYLLRRACYRPVWISQRRSPGGKGWHVELQVKPSPQSAVEVAALQAILGSDRAREACNLHRARMVDAKKVPSYWRQTWNVLYRL